MDSLTPNFVILRIFLLALRTVLGSFLGHILLPDSNISWEAQELDEQESTMAAAVRPARGPYYYFLRADHG